MKLTKNEKRLLDELIKNPRISNKELSKILNLTTQGIGKIRKSLDTKGVIDRYEVVLNYDKLGIKCLALTLVKIMPKAFRRYRTDIKEILSHPNILTSINIPQTNITNILLFGFRDISEYSRFFKLLQERLPGIIEVKEAYVFSNDSLLKNSASDLFAKVVEQFGDKQLEPRPHMIDQK